MKSWVQFSSMNVHWASPDSLRKQLTEEFDLDFDPCPLNSQFDGLAISWAGKRVWCNPPYGRQLSQWLKKASEAEVAVFLLPSRTDTVWFHDLVLPLAKEIRFVRRRLRFNNAVHNAPFPSMVVVFGEAGAWESRKHEVSK